MSAVSAPGAQTGRFRGLLTRTLSAVVLGPLLFAAIWFGFPWIDLVAAIAGSMSRWMTAVEYMAASTRTSGRT